MEDAAVHGWSTALWWTLFGGTHLALSAKPIRSRLVARLGLNGFIFLYSFVAVVTFAGLVHYVAEHRAGAAQPFLWSTIPPIQGALVALSVFGFSLLVAGVILYPRAPMAVFRHRVVPVRGIFQFTRHPFFSGLTVWAGAHLLLASHPSTFVFFLGFVLLAIGGAWHQDRRLAAELGEPYRAYAASTSFLPLFAIATKRQRIRWREQPWVVYLIAAGLSLALFQVHNRLFDHGGLYIIATVTLGAFAASLGSKLRRQSRP